MDSRRLVVWLSAGILGFQGGTLVLDLIHCSVLSWLYVRRHGLELVVSGVSVEQRPPEGLGRLGGLSGQTSQQKPQPVPPAPAPASASASETNSPQPNPRAMPLDPTEVFCNRPRHRVDEAVGQGLSILAGLALGGSVGGGGKGEQP
ncbi:MAG: hypothetical protein ACK6BG_09505 [Cyanobacteriota bacterium]